MGVWFFIILGESWNRSPRACVDYGWCVSRPCWGTLGGLCPDARVSLNVSLMHSGPELPSLLLESRVWLCFQVVEGSKWDNGWRKYFVNSEAIQACALWAPSSAALLANLTWLQGWRAALLPPDQEGARRSLARLPGTVPAVWLALPQPHSTRWPGGQACLGLSQVTPWH